MAITPVQYVQRPEEVSTTKGKAGGGKWGQIAGTLGGAVLGGAAIAATGGTAAPAVAMGALGGAATGGSLGGLLGESIKPTKEGTTAMERRMQTMGPQMTQSNHADTLKQSLVALQTQPDHLKAEYTKPLVNAYMTASAKNYTA